MSVNDSLQKENLSKEREIRRLSKDIQKYEQTIVNLTSEISAHKYRVECSKKDAEVMVGMCSPKSEVLMEELAKHQERIRKMEHNLKCSGDSIRALRKVNVTLSEELHALRRVCAALDEQCRAAATKTAFKDEIIREMRRQLKQAKAKLKDSEVASLKDRKGYGAGEKLRSSFRSLDEGALCVQPGRGRTPSAPSHRLPSDGPLHPDSDDCHSPRLDGSGDTGSSLRHD